MTGNLKDLFAGLVEGLSDIDKGIDITLHVAQPDQNSDTKFRTEATTRKLSDIKLRKPLFDGLRGRLQTDELPGYAFGDNVEGLIFNSLVHPPAERRFPMGLVELHSGERLFVTEEPEELNDLFDTARKEHREQIVDTLCNGLAKALTATLKPN